MSLMLQPRQVRGCSNTHTDAHTHTGMPDSLGSSLAGATIHASVWQGHQRAGCSTLGDVGNICTNRGSFSLDGVYKQPWHSSRNLLVNGSQLTSYLPVDKGCFPFWLPGINFCLRELKRLT